MAFNGPSFVHAQNLAPWDWKKEKKPKHVNLGPESQLSVNKVQRGPLLVDGKRSLFVSNHSLESSKREQEPLAVNKEIVIAQPARVLEDGK